MYESGTRSSAGERYGYFRKFSSEHRIGEATQRALGKYTEPGKTKV